MSGVERAAWPGDLMRQPPAGPTTKGLPRASLVPVYLSSTWLTASASLSPFWFPSIILETDSTAIASRCSRPRPDPISNLSELKIDEQVRARLLLYLRYAPVG